MDFSLEPRASKPWAAIVRLTPAMLACLEAQPGRASVTISSTGDATLRVADNAFAFASIAEEVPGDLVRGASLDDASSASAPSDARRALRVAGSLRCRLQPKRALTGADGLAARVKRRVAEEGGGRRSGRKTKARVIMIDGEPVLRSNAYTMEDGEPSVFDKELDKDAREEGSPVVKRLLYGDLVQLLFKVWELFELFFSSLRK